MRLRTVAAAALVAALPQLALAQGTTTSSTTTTTTTTTQPAMSTSPVSDAFKQFARTEGKNLMAAAEQMPADKFGFKPTPAQMSWADIMTHLAEGNDYLCGAIGGMKAPERTKVAAADGKEKLVARLKETFAFCDQALANLDDSKLGEMLPFFGGRPMSRAGIMTITTGDWADHYSQLAIYMRLNGQLPPTAKKPGT